MNELLPSAPRRPKKYEYRASDCETHGNRCAMRRERGTEGPFECVFCANERTAAALLQPSLPPVPPPAAEPPTPTEEPADPAAEGREVVCSKPTRFNHEVGHLCVALEWSLREWSAHKITSERLGLELLRISNELHTESKRLRAPVSAHQASEAPSGGAELSLPAGWRKCTVCERFPCFVYGHSACVVDAGYTVYERHGGGWNWTNCAGDVEGTAPTMLQAMCAALGLGEPHALQAGGWALRVGDEANVYAEDTADEACRSALKRFHARQQPALSLEMLGKPLARLREQEAREGGCECRWLSNKRSPSRWCRVEEHASEWRTLAEQRSADVHEDGTPRAGCGYCASTPELDASERGLR